MLRNSLLVLVFALFIIPFVMFFIKKTSYFLPKIKFNYIEYENQDKFQVIKEGYYIFKNQKSKLQDEYLYTYSFKPIGYVRFKKTGKEIDFILAETNQVFWTKETFFYPYLEPNGNFLFGINSDRTHIEVMDINGNSLYIFNGIFLVDLQCSQNQELICTLLFSDGKLILFSKSFFQEIFLNIDKAFFKSLRLFKNTLTLHYYKENQDVFITYLMHEQKDEKKFTFIKLEEITSKTFFPYTIPFCKLDKTIIFTNFNSIIKIQKDTKKISLNPYREEMITEKEPLISVNPIGNAGYFYEFCITFHQKQLNFWSNKGNFLFSYNLNTRNINFYTEEDYYLLSDDGYLMLSF